MPITSDTRRLVRTCARPVAKALWPAVERAAQLTRAPGPDAKELRFVMESRLTETFDQALDMLTPPEGGTIDQYRALLQPTDVTKRHILALEKDEPVALVSLRRRRQFWEPVSFQCLPGYIAPARDKPTLGRVLQALGMDIRIDGGLEEDVLELSPPVVHAYDVVRIDLHADYEAYWEREDGKHRKHISSARKKCKRMHLETNNKRDIERIVNCWKENWKGSSSDETGAAQDRINFWNSLPTSARAHGDLILQIHALYDGDEFAAGTIATSKYGIQLGQCLAQVRKYRNRGAGTRALHLTLEHARDAGFRYHDIGGGHGYKLLWGPVNGKRYSAMFGPAFLRKLDWVHAN